MSIYSPCLPNAGVSHPVRPRPNQMAYSASQSNLGRLADLNALGIIQNGSQGHFMSNVSMATRQVMPMNHSPLNFSSPQQNLDGGMQNYHQMQASISPRYSSRESQWSYNQVHSQRVNSPEGYLESPRQISPMNQQMFNLQSPTHLPREYSPFQSEERYLSTPNSALTPRESSPLSLPPPAIVNTGNPDWNRTVCMVVNSLEMDRE